MKLRLPATHRGRSILALSAAAALGAWLLFIAGQLLAGIVLSAVAIIGFTRLHRERPQVQAIDPDRPCPHQNFIAEVAVNRIARADDDPTIVGYYADATVRCGDCGERFRWIGVPAGMSPARPMVSPDETELRAPIRPASADPDFGMGLPGFAIRMYGGDAR